MAEERTHRRLSTIIAADVAGYSRLMEIDEERTHAAFRVCFGVFADLIVKHGGQIFGGAGDSIMADFESPVEAVRAGAEIQSALSERPLDLPGRQPMLFRIGINLGDVMAVREGLVGDAVNVAARLQELADPGGICISASVYEQVENKLPLAFDDLGAHAVKNITKPVHVFRVRLGKSAPEGPNAVPSSPHKPSIAVLPFTNLSMDAAQQYFSDGLTEDIITELSRFHSLFVIARHSSFSLRDQHLDVAEMGRRLGVQYIVEGSVLRSDDRLRITARLINAGSGIQVWADKYDRPIQDIFSVQDEVVRAIVAMVSDRVDDAGMQSARRKRPGNLLAYDYFLRGAAYHLSYDRTDNQTARAMFEKAIALEPSLAAAYAWLATQHMRDWFSHQSTEASDRAFALAQKGVALDPGDSVCEMMLGFVCLYRKQLDDAVLHVTRAITLNPNDPNNAVTMALLQTYFGNADEAIEWMNRAFGLNPYPPPWYFSLHGTVLYVAHRYADAVAALRRVGTSLDPSEYVYLMASMGQLGRIEEAQRHAAEFRALYPETAIRQIVALEPFRDARDREHLLDGLRKVGSQNKRNSPDRFH